MFNSTIANASESLSLDSLTDDVLAELEADGLIIKLPDGNYMAVEFLDPATLN